MYNCKKAGHVFFFQRIRFNIYPPETCAFCKEPYNEVKAKIRDAK